MLEGIGPTREQPSMCLKPKIEMCDMKSTLYKATTFRKK